MHKFLGVTFFSSWVIRTMKTMKSAASNSRQLRPSMMKVLRKQQNTSKSDHLSAACQHASCATASLAAKLMAVLKEELISLHSPGELKKQPAAKHLEWCKSKLHGSVSEIFKTNSIFLFLFYGQHISLMGAFCVIGSFIGQKPKQLRCINIFMLFLESFKSLQQKITVKQHRVCVCNSIHHMI